MKSHDMCISAYVNSFYSTDTSFSLLIRVRNFLNSVGADQGSKFGNGNLVALARRASISKFPALGAARRVRIFKFFGTGAARRAKISKSLENANFCITYVC